MKKLLNLKGTKQLDREEQQIIHGGWATDTCTNACNEGPINPYYFKCYCGIQGDEKK